MTKVPEFMDEASRAHVRETMRENSNLWIEAARYNIRSQPNLSARLALVMDASTIESISSLAQWRSEMADYGSIDLRQGGRTRGDNPDRPFRTFFMAAAIKKLLDLVNAPPAIVEDLEHLLKSSQPGDAPHAAALQEILISRPELANFPSKLAALVKCDRKLVARYIADGRVQVMP